MDTKKDIILSWPKGNMQNKFVDNINKMLEAKNYTLVGFDPLASDANSVLGSTLVVHWLDAVFWEGRSTLALCKVCLEVLFKINKLRLQGVKIVWFVHNLDPHDISGAAQIVWNLYSNKFASMCDSWVVLSKSNINPCIVRFPLLQQKNCSVILHPPYESEFFGTKHKAREQLEIDDEKIVFGHIGSLKKYKGLDKLVTKFIQASIINSKLYIHGSGNLDFLGNLKESFAPDVVINSSHLSGPEFDRALIALDIFVAPYSDFFHSGAIIHALSRGLVVVAPKTPFTLDLAELIGDRWFVLYEGELDKIHFYLAIDLVKQNFGVSPSLEAFLPKANIGNLLKII